MWFCDLNLGSLDSALNYWATSSAPGTALLEKPRYPNIWYALWDIIHSHKCSLLLFQLLLMCFPNQVLSLLGKHSTADLNPRPLLNGLWILSISPLWCWRSLWWHNTIIIPSKTSPRGSLHTPDSLSCHIHGSVKASVPLPSGKFLNFFK